MKKKDKVIIHKLTEEQMNELPFPKTAKIIGGIMVIESEPVDPDLADEMAAQWQAAINNSKNVHGKSGNS